MRECACYPWLLGPGQGLGCVCVCVAGHWQTFTVRETVGSTWEGILQVLAPWRAGERSNCTFHQNSGALAGKPTSSHPVSSAAAVGANPLMVG
jgi:hypothetical protein